MNYQWGYMNRFETERKNFWLLPISIIIGIGSCYVGIKEQTLILIGFGLFMALCFPIFAWSHQMKIELNPIERYIHIFYPILKKNIHLKYDQIEKIYIRKNIYGNPGVYDEITIFSKKQKVNIKSDEIKFFSDLENKIKHELNDKLV